MKNFDEIKYFEILDLDNEEEIKVGACFESIYIRNEFCCILPEKIRLLVSLIYYKYEGFSYYDYDTLDDWEDNYLFKQTILPVESEIEKVLFFKTETIAEYQFKIVEIYNTRNLLNYYLNKNINHRKNYTYFGIDDKFLTLLPVGYNYFDRIKICSCGESGCSNDIAWAVKTQEGIAIPFIIDTNRFFVFNLNNYEDQDEESFNQDLVESRESYNTFEFLWRSKNFDIDQRFLFKNKFL